MMATLKAMFKLFDGYSTTIDKISRGTDAATNKIIKASRGTDEFNDKLNATGASANTAFNGLKKLVGAFLSLAALKKGMDITDEYINTASRLSLINDGLQTQAELQDKIFAAADRARGSYSDMADAVAKMGLLAGDAFKSNNELLAFTELVQKSFKVSGADTSEQQGAMRQLSQAMASGRLQGDELVSIMENAPMMYEAIAKYTKKSKGELKDMGKDGEITADIIKNAMFMAADDINAKFAKMPMTFADIWNRIKNSATRAFSGVMGKINKLINSDKFNTAVNGMIRGLALIANIIINIIDVASRLGSFISDNWLIIEPIIWGIVGALIAYNAISLITNGIIAGQAFLASVSAAAKMMEAGATFIATAAQYGLNAALLACPLAWIILGIAAIVTLFYVVIALINKTTGKSISATGIIVGGIYVIGAAFKNLGLLIANIGKGIWNALGAVANNIKIAFNNTWINIQTGWLGFVETVLKGVQNIIGVLNKIPGVSIDTNGISNKIMSFANKKATLYMQKQGYEDVGNAFSEGFNTYDAFSKGWASDAYNSGYAVGVDLKGKAKNFLDAITKKENPYDNKGFDFEPVAVKGTGKDGAVKVDMSDEDLKYLRDIAERDYINKFSTATLAPNITVQFGDVHEEADANKVAGRIKKILQEEIATAAEGAY